MSTSIYYPSLKVTSVRFFNKELGCMDCYWVPDYNRSLRLAPSDVRASINLRYARIRAMSKN